MHHWRCERERFCVKGDTASQPVPSDAIAYGMTCVFLLVRLVVWQAVLAGVLRVCSETNYAGPFLDTGWVGSVVW